MMPGSIGDKALLPLPIVGFLPAGDKRIKATAAQIERDLLVKDLLRDQKSRSPATARRAS